ncbi:hypothetical protein BJ878DRAFT_485830 [Calycina marina]|uniref:MYND-type domain-containing protein n=1 Tax=Calycina marina TaxID=1763456 RepID=A0A9P8CJ16_9HELO|nr:hypothetical protein BJ878DRAFT_485830 [Calycina marina]
MPSKETPKSELNQKPIDKDLANAHSIAASKGDIESSSTAAKPDIVNHGPTIAAKQSPGTEMTGRSNEESTHGHPPAGGSPRPLKTNLPHDGKDNLAEKQETKHDELQKSSGPTTAAKKSPEANSTGRSNEDSTYDHSPATDSSIPSTNQENAQNARVAAKQRSKHTKISGSLNSSTSKNEAIVESTPKREASSGSNANLPEKCKEDATSSDNIASYSSVEAGEHNVKKIGEVDVHVLGTTATTRIEFGEPNLETTVDTNSRVPDASAASGIKDEQSKPDVVQNKHVPPEQETETASANANDSVAPLYELEGIAPKQPSTHDVDVGSPPIPVIVNGSTRASRASVKITEHTKSSAWTVNPQNPTSRSKSVTAASGPQAQYAKQSAGHYRGSSDNLHVTPPQAGAQERHVGQANRQYQQNRHSSCRTGSQAGSQGALQLQHDGQASGQYLQNYYSSHGTGWQAALQAQHVEQASGQYLQSHCSSQETGWQGGCQAALQAQHVGQASGQYLQNHHSSHGTGWQAGSQAGWQIGWQAGWQAGLQAYYGAQDYHQGQQGYTSNGNAGQWDNTTGVGNVNSGQVNFFVDGVKQRYGSCRLTRVNYSQTPSPYGLQSHYQANMNLPLEPAPPPYFIGNSNGFQAEATSVSRTFLPVNSPARHDPLQARCSNCNINHTATTGTPMWLCPGCGFGADGIRYCSQDCWRTHAWEHFDSCEWTYANNTEAPFSGIFRKETTPMLSIIGRFPCRELHRQYLVANHHSVLKEEYGNGLYCVFAESSDIPGSQSTKVLASVYPKNDPAKIYAMHLTLDLCFRVRDADIMEFLFCLICHIILDDKYYQTESGNRPAQEYVLGLFKGQFQAEYGYNKSEIDGWFANFQKHGFLFGQRWAIARQRISRYNVQVLL